MPSIEELNRIMETMLSETLLADTEKNGDLIREFLESHGFEFTLDNTRKAIQVLACNSSLPSKLEFRKPNPPAPQPPPAPPEPITPVEVLSPGQLSIHASEWELKQASPAQLKDYLKRARSKK